MRARRPAWPLLAALALHGAVAAALATAPLRRLLPAVEPAAVELVATPAPAPQPVADMPLTGAADLQEAIPGPVTWPQAPAPAPAPQRAAGAPRRASLPETATAPAPAAGPVAATADEIAAWQAALSAWVERHRRYPPAARFRQEEGVVRVRFELDPAGAVRHVALETPSGSQALDAAALAMLTGATLPAPPPGLDPARRSVSLAIRYRLE
jgi:protein TonB